MLIKTLYLTYSCRKNALFIFIYLFVIPTGGYPATSNELYTSIESNFSNINNSKISMPISGFLVNYLKFDFTNPGSYPQNLTSIKTSVFNSLFETKQTIDESTMTLSTINSIASLTATSSTNSLFDSLIITPKVNFFNPLNQNHYLNFDSTLVKNKYTSESEIMKTGITSAMLINYILQPYNFIKSIEQSDADWETELSRTWSMIAQHSVSYKIFHNSLKERLIIDNLGENLSASTDNTIEQDTSYLDLSEYQNMRRVHSQEWSNTISQSSEILLHRATLFSLAELARTLLIQYKQGQEILTSISGKLAGQAGFVLAAKSILAPEIDTNVPIPSGDIQPLVIETEEDAFTAPPPVETPQSRSSGSSFFCFISSTIFGEQSKETKILRRFRDRELLNYSIGQNLVTIYYIVSPDIIVINNHTPILNEIFKNYLSDFISIIE